MNLSPEERAIGKGNFNQAVEYNMTRRGFLGGAAAATVVAGAGLGGMYFGYKKSLGDPLRVGIIGTGDEGGVLIGALNPEFINVVAIADIRPYNVHRAFHGDESSANARKVRTGLMQKYKWDTEDTARKNVAVYEDGYESILDDKNVEAVIIALPLFLHHDAAIKAMQKGKHVLTEKLMGHTVQQCKEMARAAKQYDRILAVGHQRHYSILYENAVDTIKSGLIGELHHIRAQWHRGNLPGRDSWSPPLPDQIEKDLASLDKRLAQFAEDEKKLDSGLLKKFAGEFKADRDALLARKKLLELQLKDKTVDAAKHGYVSTKLTDGRVRSELEELIRWRLWNRTGGGLMAELGSHQLDASGIFCTAPRRDGKKAMPISVVGVGGRHLFPPDRDCDDHVYCTYEFPGPGYEWPDPRDATKTIKVASYEEDPNKKIVVTYSSINGNGFGGYGEVVMGTKGTMILDGEQEVMLFKDSATTTRVRVTAQKPGGAVLDTTESGGGEAAAAGKAVMEAPSRGYTEEIEHWAWCIRNPSPENQPRCRPEVALADAVIALTSNIAIRKQTRIEFNKDWFNVDSDATPEKEHEASTQTAKS